jgi:protease I
VSVLILTAEGFEDMELFVPYYRFLEEGMEVDIASIKRGKIRGKHDYEVEAGKSFEEINPEQYDVLFLPGGKAPSKIRDMDSVHVIARHFFESGKTVAAICHGPQILISAGLVKGKRMTSWPEVGKELRSAGAIYEDKRVVVEGNLITSRKPEDLPWFNNEVIKRIKGEIPATPF